MGLKQGVFSPDCFPVKFFYSILLVTSRSKEEGRQTETKDVPTNEEKRMFFALCDGFVVDDRKRNTFLEFAISFSNRCMRRLVLIVVEIPF